MSATHGIRNLLCPVSDLAAAKRVYSALLGVAPDPDSDFYVGFDTGDQHIGLLPGGGPQAIESPVPYWSVEDIEAKLAELIAAGASVKEELRSVGHGRRVAAVTDRDGNVLGLMQDE